MTYDMIVEQLDETRLRVTTPKGSAILQIDGLGDQASPFLKITQTCADCGKVVGSTTYDVTAPPPDLAVFMQGEAEGNAMLEHWAAHRAS